MSKRSRRVKKLWHRSLGYTEGVPLKAWAWAQGPQAHGGIVRAWAQGKSHG